MLDTRDLGLEEGETVSETKEKRKHASTRVAERLLKVKQLLHGRTLIELGDVEKMVDACLADLTPKKKGKKP